MKIGGRLAAAGLIAAVLGGCGVKSSPKYPAGATYPGQYPQPLPGMVVTPKADDSKSGQTPGANPPDGFYQYPNQAPIKPTGN